MASVLQENGRSTTISVEATAPDDDRTSDPVVMRTIVSQFYQKLYTTDPVPETVIDDYLQTMEFRNKVSQEDNDGLLSDITIDEILEQSKRSPKQSSPGDDGLGYQFLDILYKIPGLQPLILEVYNDALKEGVSPRSWKDIRVRLLPKKGDLTNLKNWRPISLINCDAKIFTRLLNARLSDITNNIIQPEQTGFMRGCFIGDNGLLLHLLTQQARLRKYAGVGLLLDQEKAYDRANPLYLLKVLESFEFHSTFVECVQNLFFGNQVQINVNGFWSPTVNQQRGLRQGGPLSPILFNLALEPLLMAINQDDPIIGYRYETPTQVQSIKLLAYADDICTILYSKEDYDKLQVHLESYSSVSNAKFNQDKTEAFSLSGKMDHTWKDALLVDNINKYYTNQSPEPFRYLGFYMVSTTVHRQWLQTKLLQTIRSTAMSYPSRNISLRGRVTVMNTLIMTKIWYCLRLFQPTQGFLNQL